MGKVQVEKEGVDFVKKVEERVKKLIEGANFEGELKNN